MLKVKAKAVESAVADLNAAEERVGNAQSEAKNFAIEWRNERARRLKDLDDDVRRLEVSLQELGERSFCLACSMISWLGFCGLCYKQILAYPGWCPCSDGHNSLRR